MSEVAKKNETMLMLAGIYGFSVGKTATAVLNSMHKDSALAQTLSVALAFLEEEKRKARIEEHELVFKRQRAIMRDGKVPVITLIVANRLQELKQQSMKE